VTWYDTETGQPTTTETRAADGAGTLMLNISNLKTDSAVKIARAGH
jgi:outer membrane lipoprotein-sorting protein